jgi:hypothetical protein
VKPLSNVGKGAKVRFAVLAITAGGGMAFVEAQPGTSLLAAFIVELGIDPAEAQGGNESSLNPVGEQAGMHAEVDERFGHGSWLRGGAIWRGPCL